MKVNLIFSRIDHAQDAFYEVIYWDSKPLNVETNGRYLELYFKDEKEAQDWFSHNNERLLDLPNYNSDWTGEGDPDDNGMPKYGSFE